MKLNHNDLQSFEELPQRWTVTTLGAILPLTYGKALKKETRDESGMVPVYGSSGQVGVHSNALTKKPALIVGRKGSVGEVYRSPVPCWPIDTVYFVEERDDCDLKYFEHLLKGLRLSKLDKSTAVPGLSRDDYNAVEVAVAPLDQQKRIVAEIEKQFSRLDEAVANLKRVKANLKRYKAAVLKAAVEGRLVETEAELARKEGRSLPTPRPGVFYAYAIRCVDDSIYVGHTDNLARRWEEHLAGQAADWTKQHKPMQIVHYAEYQSRQEAADREKWLKTGYGRKWIKREIEAGRARQVGYETGEQLLERILETRRLLARNAQASSQWLARAEQAGGKGKGKYREPGVPDTTDLPELPEGWVWATVDQLAAPKPNSITDGPFGSNLKTEHYQESGPRVIRLQNIKDGEFADEYAHISPAHFERLRKHEIHAGDLVIASLGDNPPRACIIPPFVGPAIVKADCIRFKSHSALTVAYLNAALNCQPTRQRVKSVLHGIGRPRLSLDEIRAIALPIPPETEQHRIAAEVDRRLSLDREVESQVDANLLRAERLRQSILSSAFLGQLTSVPHIGRTTIAILEGAGS
ncbi:MAG: restriction endonuclease subunit S [Sulfuricaulis sp.]|uniref:restriction endonuclease subunit S n=1 Tax=Sulfuricaulis sp. TaxID=2003553 RepID=UPI0034A31393